LNQYVYKIMPMDHKRCKTITRYGETPPLTVGHEYYGTCNGEYGRRQGQFKVLGIEIIRECG
jgi:hypothetical protein